MPLEQNPQTIADLDITSPASTDSTIDAAPQFQNLKKVLKNVFIGANGDGFSEPVTATETELNYSVGVTSPIQAQLDADRAELDANKEVLHGPNGLTLFTWTAVPPDGWVAFEAENYYNLMVGPPSAVGVSGGRTDPRRYAHQHAVPEWRLSTAQLPSHHHGLTMYNSATVGLAGQVSFGKWFTDDAGGGDGVGTTNNVGSSAPINLTTAEEVFEPLYSSGQLITRDTSLD